MGAQHQHVLFLGKCDVLLDGKSITQEPVGLLLEATSNLAQHEPSMKAHRPTDQPNDPHAYVNIGGVDDPEVVDAVTNEYIAFYGHYSQSHLGH